MFTPDTTAPGSRSYSLASAGMIDGDIYVALNGNEFAADAVNMVRATISYDPAVVTPVTFSSSNSWMEAFGVQSTFKVTKSGSNLIKVSVDMHHTSTGASGSGTILRIRFRKVGSGTTRLDFTDANAYDSGFNNSLQSTHGGTLIVQ